MGVLKEINKRQSLEIERLMDSIVPIEKEEEPQEKFDTSLLEKEISDLKLKLVDAESKVAAKSIQQDLLSS